jgi:hypothetical protein
MRNSERSSWRCLKHEADSKRQRFSFDGVNGQAGSDRAEG